MNIPKNKNLWGKLLLLNILFYLGISADAQRLSMDWPGYVLYICEDSTISAIGYDAGYQLGDGTNIDRNMPVKVKGLHNVVAVNASGAMALLSDGTVWKWLWQT